MYSPDEGDVCDDELCAVVVDVSCNPKESSKYLICIDIES